MIYKLFDYCIDVLFDKISKVFVDSRDLVKEIKVGNSYKEIYSIFYTKDNVRVENWFYHCNVVAKEKDYIELICRSFQQIYRFNSQEDAMRYNRGHIVKSSHSIKLFSISKGEVTELTSDDFINTSMVEGNNIYIQNYMKDKSVIPLPITCKPDGIMSITE